MSIQFGAGTLTLSATAAITVARVQNVTLNVTPGDPVLLRSEGQRYPEHIGFADASIEGTFTYSDLDLTALASILGASGAFASSSGTFTLTGGATPGSFSLQVAQTTDGNSATVTLPKVYINAFTIPMSRTEHNTYEASFVVMSTGGNVLTYQGS